MSNGIYEIESRLAAWAYYKINLQAGAIGWPSRNLIVRMKEGITHAYPTTGVCLILKFDHSQQTDNWVRDLGVVNPKLKEAITLYYTCKQPIGKIANALGVTRRTFERRVQAAKIWLATRLQCFTEAQSSSL